MKTLKGNNSHIIDLRFKRIMLPKVIIYGGVSLIFSET